MTRGVLIFLADIEGSVTEDKMEGYLYRKPTMDAPNRKAPIRQWKQFYVILQDQVLHFYKDQKTARAENEAAHSMPTAESYVEVATDYTKRKNVFRFRSNTGQEFLFQAKDDDDMNLWIRRIKESYGKESTPERKSEKRSSGIFGKRKSKEIK